MYDVKLAGTATVYDRHVFLCYKSPEVWPSRLESSDSDPLAKLLAATPKARRNLKESDVDAFVEDVLVNGHPWTLGPQEAINGSYVFVCAHNSRDRRCCVCGPILIEKFSKAIESKGLKNEVHVAGCSHVGGRKYAGNVIIFSSDKEGKIAGHC